MGTAIRPRPATRCPRGDGVDRGAEDLASRDADAAEVADELVPNGAGPGKIGPDGVEVAGVG